MLSSLYRALCHIGDKVFYPWLPPFAKVFWNHEAGPKTIFFWAPTFKWCLVIAGISDLRRPAEKISTYQNTALFVTGMIWTRYSFVIRPINYNLASVNFFVSLTGFYQLLRKRRHSVSQKQLLS
ncbi:unnamed protein product [Litomosoides sigmodontis]|uniref:Mitochondrial pyruvate carrier n=1 Tax=Litomosoides sigmodontis TaxID=42156 RepID=A0A3P6S9U8_LITSI|nr:unnamed protein product [Litomosoides sigmodontis]